MEVHKMETKSSGELGGSTSQSWECRNGRFNEHHIDSTHSAWFIHGHQHVNVISVRGAATRVSIIGEECIDMNA